MHHVQVCTLEMKTEVSMIDLMCFNHPLFSIPDRNDDIDGFFSSHTETIRWSTEVVKNLTLVPVCVHYDSGDQTRVRCSKW